MATFNKFNNFVQFIGTKIVDLSTDVLTIALTAAANPPAATNNYLGDLTEISYTNLSSRVVTTTSYTNSSGTSKLVLADLVLTASGTVATFRYVVLYDSTPSPNKPLIGWYDYGSNLSLSSGQTLTIDWDQSAGALTIA